MRALLCWVFCAWILLLLGARRCSVFCEFVFFYQRERRRLNCYELLNSRAVGTELELELWYYEISVRKFLIHVSLILTYEQRLKRI
jgi:hypothetical protein